MSNGSSLRSKVLEIKESKSKYTNLDLVVNLKVEGLNEKICEEAPSNKS